MCLIAFSYKQHPEFELILAANRDEFYQRDTRTAQFWEEYPYLLAGKDLEAGGTWLGITKSGRFSALTNFRENDYYKPDAPSRGKLPLNYLIGTLHPQKYLEQVRKKANSYNGFNLLAGKPNALYYLSSKTLNVEQVQPGVHGISNHLLDTPWPKVEKARSRLQRIANQTEFSTEEIFQMLQDQSEAPVSRLPDTGVGEEKERRLSPIFINMDEYGTRSSALLTITRKGEVTFTERYYANGSNKITDQQHFTFDINNN